LHGSEARKVGTDYSYLLEPNSLAAVIRYCLAQIRDRPTVGQLARAHTIRFVTMIAAWALIFAAFIYHPEWIRESLRFMTHSIETIADQVPEPWARGSRSCSES